MRQDRLVAMAHLGLADEGQLQAMRDFMMDRIAWMDANLP
ncbi:hypothetical protein SCE1572_40450 [Sorangium cellulosum So0157-2]|uniref:Uncharacterized protein n=1 Tax=Sorangium cellulosum So0157-2 TaxID=1254432 RepID=S4Y7L4_SORCE|nr:hypothetical protein SCE1572_40430 [Sorangium cellulosum So0157-2]AGP40234.1 hypothetical protein SCE1572_40450 [Sorangium cellulosum So0157-2]